MAQDLLVRIIGDDKSVLRAFARTSKGAKTFERDMGRVTRGAIAGSGALSGLGKSLAFASGGFISAAAAVGLVRTAFGELNESRKVAAQTNAVLASTGEIAGVTAQHVDELGNALLRKTGIDDEAIRSAENLLLTFTNVRNVVGPANDIFDQATKAILDMSVAMGGDLEGATIRVGKALQDPIKGVTALRRVGVLLTVAQEAQVKAFIKAGETLKAQKVILAELTREFGGSAEAAGNVQPWNLLRETLKNLGADLAASLLPQIQSVTARLQAWFDDTRNIERIQRDFARTIEVAREVMAGFVSAFETLQKVLGPVVRELGGAGDAVKLLLELMVLAKVRAFAAGIALVGTNAQVSGGKVSALSSSLRGLSALNLITIPIILDAFIPEDNQRKINDFFTNLGRSLHIPKGLVPFLVPFSSPTTTAEDRRRRTPVSAAADAKSAIEDRIGALPGRTAREKGAEEATIALKDEKKTVKKAVDAAKAARDAFNRFLDSLELGVERARATAGLEDDLVELRKVERALKERLKIEKNSVDLQRQLFQTEQDIADVQKRRRDARQFQALGLTATGEEKIPGLVSLRRQLGNVTDAVKGTFLDTAKTKSLMAQIRKILSGGFGAVSEDVRAKIRDMLADINRQLNDQRGQLTKFRGIDSDKFLEGITGLTADQRRAIRSRVAQVGRGGTVPQRGVGALGFAVPSGGGNIIISGPLTIKADSPDAFIRELHKKTRRTATQTTGPHAGNGSGFVR